MNLLKPSLNLNRLTTNTGRLGSFFTLRTTNSRAIPMNIYGRAQTRCYSEESTKNGPGTQRRPFRPILALLFVASMGATAYSIYELYGIMTMWPKELRTDLRGGLKARDKGDLDLSESFLQRAWTKSKTLPIEVFEIEPYLKTSGIAILLASVLEANGKPEKAYDVYTESLTQLQLAGTVIELSGPETLRAIAISYKLGELAADLQRTEDEERHLVWAVESILKSVFRLGEQLENVTPAENHVPEGTSSLANHPSTRMMLSELSLPEWATKTDIAAPLEALGAFYAHAGRVDFALPLYLQAISILIPAPPQDSTDDDRCRGAQLMANLSELIIRSQPKLSDEILHQAEAWALQGLQITMKAKEELPTINPTCELAFAVALFNVAALRRMAGDTDEAKKLFALSLKQSKTIGLQNGIEHAEQALRELGATIDPPPAAI